MLQHLHVNFPVNVKRVLSFNLFTASCCLLPSPPSPALPCVWLYSQMLMTKCWQKPIKYLNCTFIGRGVSEEALLEPAKDAFWPKTSTTTALHAWSEIQLSLWFTSAQKLLCGTLISSCRAGTALRFIPVHVLLYSLCYLCSSSHSTAILPSSTATLQSVATDEQMCVIIIHLIPAPQPHYSRLPIYSRCRFIPEKVSATAQTNHSNTDRYTVTCKYVQSTQRETEGAHTNSLFSIHNWEQSQEIISSSPRWAFNLHS